MDDDIIQNFWNKLEPSERQLLDTCLDQCENAVKKKRKDVDKENVPPKKMKTEIFTCDICGKSIKRKDNFVRHQREHQKCFSCEHCGKAFTRKYTLNQHTVMMHKKSLQTANIQSPIPGPSRAADVHSPINPSHDVVKEQLPVGSHVDDVAEQSTHQMGGTISAIHRFSDESSLRGNANIRNIFPNNEDEMDLLFFFRNVRDEVRDHLLQQVQVLRGIKWYLSIQVEMEKEDKEGNRQSTQPHFRSKVYVYLPSEELDEHNLNEAFQKMYVTFEDFIHQGSNWTLKKIMKIGISTANYSPLGGSSYIPTPNTFCRNNTVVNVINNDEKCFLWSVLASMHSVQEVPERVSHYVPYEHSLDMTDITYPVSISDILKFERRNNISVNVFGFEDKDIFPLYITKIRESQHHANLLYLKKGEKSHYCLISNLNGFLSRTKSQNNESFFCHFCLHGFVRKDLLNKHIEICSRFEPQLIELPKEGENNLLEFHDFEKQMKVPFYIVADFECYAQRIDHCLPDNDKSNTTKTIKFEPCGFGYQVISIDDRYTKPPVIYRGSNVSKTFLESILEEEKQIKEILSNIQPLNMTVENERDFQSSHKCHICSCYFSDKTIKVRDHCHLTGQFRGASCQSCNLNFKYPPFIPVVFHNLKGFDSHIICESMGLFKDHEIKCIANTMDRYISFSLGNLRFIDSFQFMSQSLEELVDNLAMEGLGKFKLLSSAFDAKEAKLLLRKGVYPYEFVSDESRFLERKLPPKEAFYSQLSKTHISNNDYEHAQNVWKTLNMTNLGDYHDLYLKTDVLLLADVFENFRDMCLNYYGLDPLHYYTSPGLAWSAALKMSGICLELLTDPDMYLFFENAIRGGVSMISNKYAKANNPYIPETYDNTQANSHILYSDCNNLYGKAMMESLPTGCFSWVDDVDSFDVSAVPPNGDLGYVLEVDLVYPQWLHDTHSDYPLAPETKVISDDMLSEHSKGLWRELHPNTKHTDKKLHGRVKTKKLVPTLENKIKYTCHYRNLQLYLQLGMKVTKIHRILQFHQYPWLKKYIEFNSQKRKEAKDDFSKNFFKLMNNSVFGKTMENVRAHKNIALTQTEKRFKKLVAKPSFERFVIFNEHLTGVENTKVKLILNKPVYVGQSILDLSKCIMYNFHYNYMMKKYDNSKIRLLFTDTDSLCYHIETDDVYRDLHADKHYFDLSNYPSDHFVYDPSNKKIPGKFKDETGGIPIKEFCGLRPKMYSFTYGKTDEKQVAKGIAKATIKHDLRHDMYRECLFKNKEFMCRMNSIRSDKHQLYVYNINKCGLNSFDDKRFCLPSGNTLAFGHYKIQNF